MDAVKLVSSEILGLNAETVSIGGEVYVVNPPTIRRLAGATMYLGGVSAFENTAELVKAVASDDLARALSWLLNGDESMTEKFLDCDVNEVALGVAVGISMIDPGNFTALSVSARNVRSLIARQKS